jgi:hypothetical protein
MSKSGADPHVVLPVECRGSCFSDSRSLQTNLTHAFMAFGVSSAYQIRGPRYVVDRASAVHS